MKNGIKMQQYEKEIEKEEDEIKKKKISNENSNE